MFNRNIGPRTSISVGDCNVSKNTLDRLAYLSILLVLAKQACPAQNAPLEHADWADFSSPLRGMICAKDGVDRANTSFPQKEKFAISVKRNVDLWKSLNTTTAF